MAAPTYVNGQVLDQTDCNNWFVPIAAFKGTDQTGTPSSTTLINDTDLVATLPASGVWQVTALLNYTATAAASIKWTWTIPTAAQGRYQPLYLASGVAFIGGAAGSFLWTDVGIADGLGTTIASIGVNGIIQTFASSGTFQLQWAQAVSNATANVMKVRSFLECRRIG